MIRVRQYITHPVMGLINRLYLFAFLFGPVCAQSADHSARGVVIAQDRVTLSSEIAAKLVEVPWREGDFFKKQQVLVSFDCRLFKAQQDKVKAEYKAAKLRSENAVELAGVNSISQLEVDLAEVQLQQASSELEMANLNVQRCIVTAPWSGRVVQRHVQANESVQLNQELLTIVSQAPPEIELVVPGDWLQWLKVGHAFVFDVDEIAQKLKARVQRLGAEIDAGSQTLVVRATVESHPRLLPGMSGSAQFKR